MNSCLRRRADFIVKQEMSKSGILHKRRRAMRAPNAAEKKTTPIRLIA